MGCRNVQTLYQTGKLAQVIKEMQSYKIKLLVGSGTRWTGSGSRQLLSGHHILYSGRADDHHSRSVRIIITKEVHKSLLEWKPISERIIKARYNSAFAKLRFIAAMLQLKMQKTKRKTPFMMSCKQWMKHQPTTYYS